MSGKRPWYEIEPKDATGITLPNNDIWGPISDITGEECPWPWDPPQFLGLPIGMYHCPYCGSMILGGADHVDYRDQIDDHT